MSVVYGGISPFNVDTNVSQKILFHLLSLCPLRDGHFPQRGEPPHGSVLLCGSINDFLTTEAQRAPRERKISHQSTKFPDFSVKLSTIFSIFTASRGRVTGSSTRRLKTDCSIQ
ncbi:hypothetical protein NIES4103_24830 [Nostoc sp. NIES-4103]|nr:hypothetical protein NIES4103_24830 [Nostoc sp. NIES-4103]